MSDLGGIYVATDQTLEGVIQACKMVFGKDIDEARKENRKCEVEEGKEIEEDVKEAKDKT